MFYNRRSMPMLGLLALAASVPALEVYARRKPEPLIITDSDDPPATPESADTQDLRATAEQTSAAGSSTIAHGEPRREDFPSRQTYRAALRAWNKRAS